jgi:hypothetical protein
MCCVNRLISIRVSMTGSSHQTDLEVSYLKTLSMEKYRAGGTRPSRRCPASLYSMAVEMEVVCVRKTSLGSSKLMPISVET